jgi:hypothetical protein
MREYKSQEPTGGSRFLDFEVVKLISSSSSSSSAAAAARHHPGDFHLLRPGGLSGKACQPGLT